LWQSSLFEKGELLLRDQKVNNSRAPKPVNSPLPQRKRPSMQRDDMIPVFCYIRQVKAFGLPRLALFLICCTALWYCATATPVSRPAHNNLNPEQLKTMVDKKAKMVLVDTRTEYEFRKGRIPGAINISPDRFGKLGELLPTDKGAHLVFYCRGSA
jgi:hypothetical protein